MTTGKVTVAATGTVGGPPPKEWSVELKGKPVVELARMLKAEGKRVRRRAKIDKLSGEK